MPNNQIPGLETTGALTGWNTNARGEATQVGTATSSGSSLGLGWDGLGQVKTVSWNEGSQTYRYAPSGMRVRTSDALNPSNNREFVYSALGLLLAEYDGDWRRDVIYLGSQAVAEIDADGIHELHSDHLGSPRLVTKGAGIWGGGNVGNVDGTQAFGPYGELVSQTGYIPLTGYTGHVQTDSSGLIYMRGRYYSPAWHAFVNSDQGVDPSTWNQRAYVNGSPFNLNDPTGLSTVCYTITTTTWHDVNDNNVKDPAEKTISVVTWRVCTGSVSGEGVNSDFTNPSQPPRMDVDCAKLRQLGVTSEGWNRMVRSMIQTDGLAALGFNSLEFGFMHVGGEYYLGAHITHEDGRPGLRFPRIQISSGEGGYEYHSHPPGFDGLASPGSHFSIEDRAFMSGWPAGNSIVGAVGGLWLMTSGRDTKLGGEKWWEADCF